MTLRTSPVPAYTVVAEYFYIRSSSIPNRYYLVVMGPNGIRCECKAGQNGRKCWHSELVASGMATPARLKPSPHTTPRTPTVWERGHHGDLYA